MRPDRPRAEDLHTRRLVLRATTPQLLRAELAGNHTLAVALSAVVPDGWPPGEHNLDAVRHFLEFPALLTGGWSDYYAIARATPDTPATLVASIGFQALPDGAGRVEVGYSVVDTWRRRGIATEAVGAMVGRAHSHGLRSVIAHARPDNHASIAVLTKNRFRPATSTRDHQLGFERHLYTVRRAGPLELRAINGIYASLDFQPTAAGDLQLVADSGGDLVGLGRLAAIRDASHLELGGIWVAPYLRGEGAAKAIVRALIDLAGPQPLACLPFAHLEPLYATFGFAPWDPALAPPALQHKLDFCARTYPQPVSLMLRRP